MRLVVVALALIVTQVVAEGEFRRAQRTFDVWAGLSSNPVVVAGVVDGFPRDGIGKVEAPVRLADGVRVQLSTVHFVLQPGDVVLMRGTLSPIRPQLRSFARARRLHGNIKGKVKIVGRVRHPRTFGYRIHIAIRSRLRRALGADAGSAEALLLGNRGRMSFVARRQVRASGLAHVFALSGLHLGLVVAASLPIWIILPRARPFGIAMLALGYVGLVAFVPSLVRAGLFVTLSSLTVASGRPYHWSRALTLAVFVAILAEPSIIHAAGFQLSVLATFAVVLAAGRVARWGGNLGLPGAATAMAGSLVVGAHAQSVTAPLVARMFSQWAPAGVGLSLVAVPAAATVMVAGFFGIICGTRAPAQIIVAFADDALMHLAGWGASWQPQIPPWWMLTLIAVFALSGRRRSYHLAGWLVLIAFVENL